MGRVATLTSPYNVYLLTSVDVVPLMKTAGVIENSGHCIYSIGLKYFRNCLSLFHLVFFIYIQIYVYIYIYITLRYMIYVCFNLLCISSMWHLKMRIRHALLQRID